jgi:3-oxoacyl-[acyl-carrier protein] reductase
MAQAPSISEPTAIIPDLRDKVVLITGASTGIGAAAARAFGRNGAKVAINYRQSQTEAEQVADAVRQLGGEA